MAGESSRLGEQTEVLQPELCSAGSQDTQQAGVTAVLARRIFSGLKRSITGHLLRDQRTGFRARFSSRVFKHRVTKARLSSA